jgi:8-oxo-dGTP pyrophosphatase MutT (NUDIX family)
VSFLDRIRTCQVFNPDDYLPFRVDGGRVGWLRPALAEVLRKHEGVFAVSANAVELAPEIVGFDQRSGAVAAVVRSLIDEAVLGDWRDEAYAVGPRFAEPLFTIDRGAVPPFGVRGYGVHLNGYVRRGGAIQMWIGRRSPTKRTAPNKLDQLVAGGQPAGLSPRQNLVKEAAEEASIPRALVEKAVPVGAITYCTEREDGLRNDVLFVYDLELPDDFEPRNPDGELTGFELVPLAEVMELVRTTEAFKFNCALVVIDFLIRHGLIGPEHPEYLDLAAGLRSGRA